MFFKHLQYHQSLVLGVYTGLYQPRECQIVNMTAERILWDNFYDPIGAPLVETRADLNRSFWAATEAEDIQQ